jgi:hypothetical protein
VKLLVHKTAIHEEEDEEAVVVVEKNNNSIIESQNCVLMQQSSLSVYVYTNFMLFFSLFGTLHWPTTGARLSSRRLLIIISNHKTISIDNPLSSTPPSSQHIKLAIYFTVVGRHQKLSGNNKNNNNKRRASDRRSSCRQLIIRSHYTIF